MPTTNRHVSAGVAGCAAFVLIGWSALVLPTLIRSIQGQFGQDDAGFGVLYLLYAIAYASGSLLGGIAVERLGRRVVLGVGPLLLAGGLVAMAAAPGWPVFLAATVPMAFGIGAVDGGVNGLFLDAFRERRGRALNSLHVFFSLGALGAPLVIGRVVEAGIAWQAVLAGTAVAALPIAATFAILPMPHGRRELPVDARDRPAGRLGLPIALLAVGIAFYVAAQGGVSNWLVRFLEPAPLETATLTLSLFWAGLTLGRVASIRIADRFDHVWFTAVALATLAVSLLAAILVPALPVRTALFALAGVAAGPIYPMIVAIAGERYPERSAAVGGLLATSAVAGTIVYPPLIGFISVAAGLQVGMLGAVVLLVVALAAILAVGRSAARPARTADAAVSEPAR